MRVAAGWDADADVCLYRGDALDLLRAMPDGCAQLVVTSPPYNLAKAYERGRRASFADYLDGQRRVIDECVRVLRPGGSICWQVGNHVTPDEIVPLDVVLYPALQATRRPACCAIASSGTSSTGCTARSASPAATRCCSGSPGAPSRASTSIPIRVPQKYPGKRAWKGTRAGEYTGHPLGKNPGDVLDLPEREGEPRREDRPPLPVPHRAGRARACSRRTDPGDLVLDPYVGVGTTACAAVLHGRRAAGAEIVPQYVAIARERIAMAAAGTLATRPTDAPVHRPDPRSALARRDGPGRVRRARPARERPRKECRSARTPCPAPATGYWQTCGSRS